MRLSGLLSKEPSKEYCQVEGFLNQKLKFGKQKNIEAGIINLPFYCKYCKDALIFSSLGVKMTCIGINNNSVSIDTVVKCPECDAVVPIWFLIESEGKDIAEQFPKVRVLKRSYKLFENVTINNEKYGKYSELLEKANIAYNNELGSGAIIYLRKVYEQIVIETAKVYGINMTTAKGYRRKFGELLEEVDSESSIVPIEFAKNKYTLFKNLSNVIHGEYSEEIALKQYPAFYRLVIGILDNINNNKELLEAVKELELDSEGEKSNE